MGLSARENCVLSLKVRIAALYSSYYTYVCVCLGIYASPLCQLLVRIVYIVKFIAPGGDA